MREVLIDWVSRFVECQHQYRFWKIVELLKSTLTYKYTLIVHEVFVDEIANEDVNSVGPSTSAQFLEGTSSYVPGPPLAIAGPSFVPGPSPPMPGHSSLVPRPSLAVIGPSTVNPSSMNKLRQVILEISHSEQSLKFMPTFLKS